MNRAPRGWRQQRPRSARSRGSAGAGWFLLVFGIPFLAAGLFMAGLYFNVYRDWLAARSWVETPCRILSAELESESGTDSTTWRATARYSYTFNGENHESDQVGLSGGSDNIGDFHRRVHRELSRHAPQPEAEPGAPPLPPFRCFVNPARPEQAVLYRDLRLEMQAFLALFALLFPLAGAGILATGATLLRNAGTRRKLSAAHPDAPWRWRPQWGETEISALPHPARWTAHGLALWGAVVLLPLPIVFLLTPPAERAPASWAALILPVLWLIPAALSLRFLRSRLATGKAALRPQPAVISPGGTLAGSLDLDKRPRLMNGVRLDLKCQQVITTTHNRQSSTHTETLWSHQHTVDSAQLEATLTSTRIPLHIALPAHLPPSGPDPADPDIEIKWTLRLTGPGTPVRADFELPVFYGPDGPPTLLSSPEEMAPLDPILPELSAALAEEGLIADFGLGAKLVSLRSPLRRSLPLLVFLALFNLLWTGFSWLLIAQQAPLVFRIVWPLSSAIIWLIILRILIYRKSFSLDDSALNLWHQLGPYRWSRAIPRVEITGFDFDSNGEVNGQPIWRVRLSRATGRPITLVGGLKQSLSAETLAAELEKWRANG